MSNLNHSLVVAGHVDSFPFQGSSDLPDWTLDLKNVLCRVAILENGQENFAPKYSPDGKEVANLENRTTIKVLHLNPKQARTIIPGDHNYSINLT
jgi:hypothetical protein